MTTEKRPKETVLSYLVIIPIADLDRKGKKLVASKRALWIKRAHDEIRECFGGSLEFPAPGTNVLDGKVLWEKGQTIMLGLCLDQPAFEDKKARLKSFAVKMGSALDQDSVLLFGFPADAAIIEIPRDPE